MPCALNTSNCKRVAYAVRLPDTTSAPLVHLGPLTPRLEALDANEQRAVFLNRHLVARYACDDRGTERVMVTQLAEVLTLPDQEIAAAFDVHPETLSRFRRQLRQGGAAALFKTAPGGPRLHPLALEPEGGARGSARGAARRAADDAVRRGVPALCGAGAGGSVGRVPAARRDHRACAVVRVGPHGRRDRLWLRPALPLDRRSQERPAGGSGRAAGHDPGPDGPGVAPEDQGLGRECGAGAPRAGPVSPLRGARAGLGRGLLRGRPLLPVLRPAPDAAGLEPALPARRPRSLGYLPPPCARARAVFHLAAAQ